MPGLLRLFYTLPDPVASQLWLWPVSIVSLPFVDCIQIRDIYKQTHQFLLQHVKRIVKVVNRTGKVMLQLGWIIGDGIVFLVSCAAREKSPGMFQL